MSDDRDSDLRDSVPRSSGGVGRRPQQHAHHDDADADQPDESYDPRAARVSEPSRADEQSRWRRSGADDGGNQGGGRGGGFGPRSDSRDSFGSGAGSRDAARGERPTNSRFPPREPSGSASGERRFPPREPREGDGGESRFGRRDPSGSDMRPSRSFDRGDAPQSDRFSRGAAVEREQPDDRPSNLRGFNRGETGGRFAREPEASSSRDEQRSQGTASRNSDVDGATDALSRASVRPTAAGATVEPVRLGGGDNTKTFAERQAERKARADQERAEGVGDRFGGGGGDRYGGSERSSGGYGAGGGRFGDRGDSSYGGYGGGGRSSYSDRVGGSEGRNVVGSSRFARAPGEERYGEGREERRGGYGAGREFGASSGGGRYGGYGSQRGGDIGELPTKPAAVREAEYEAELEARRPKPKKLEAAKAQKEIDPNDTSRYDSSVAAATAVVNKAKIQQDPLQRAIENKTSITATQLNQTLGKADLTDAKPVADVVVRSIIDGNLKLAEVVKTTQSQLSASEDKIPSFITLVLQTYRQRKNDNALATLVKDSGVDVLPIIAPGKTDDAIAEYLSQHDLSRLAPVRDISPAVNEAIAANKSASDISSVIDSSNIDSKLPVPSVRAPIAAYISKQVFSKTGMTCKSDILSQYHSLIKRVVARDAVEQVLIVRELVQGWFTAGAAKGQLKDAFVNLYDNKVLPAEAFKGWQEDTKDRSAGKMKALLQLNAWLSDLQPSVREPEPEEEEEDDEEDLQANPNFE